MYDECPSDMPQFRRSYEQKSECQQSLNCEMSLVIPLFFGNFLLCCFAVKFLSPNLCQEIEEEANVIRALYDLIEKYNVPAPPEDVAVYQTLTPSVNNMLQAIDKSLADRDANIEKFCAHLDKDIASLSKKVHFLFIYFFAHLS